MKLLVLISLLSLSLGSFSQTGPKGKPIYLVEDTIKGAETIYIELPELTGFYSLDWEIKFYELGGTSDGIGLLQMGNDTLGFVDARDVDGIITGSPNDSITISNQALYKFQIYGTTSNRYRYKLTGTVGDTTRVVSNYIKK